MTSNSPLPPLPTEPVLPQVLPQSYIGFDTITKQIEKRLLKRGFQFNLMLVGQTGVGKSTFMNTLFSSNLVDVEKEPKTIPKTTEIQMIVENGVQIKLNIIDTPGFADQVNNDFCWDPITRYIKDQYAIYLRKELSPSRERQITDTRIHCVLYFIAPSGHGLKPVDIVVMKKLSEIVNIIPVIGKSDCMTVDEKIAFKNRVNEELKFHSISVFPQEQLDTEEDNNGKELNESIRKMIPFALVGSDKLYQLNGKQVRARRNRSGLVNIEDPLHCEFIHLRNFLIRTHLFQLIDSTGYLQYEHFRTKQLMALKEAGKVQQQSQNSN